MTNLILKATNLIGLLLVIIGVMAFANLFSGIQLASGESFVPDNAATGIFFLAIGLLLFGVANVMNSFLRK